MASFFPEFGRFHLAEALFTAHGHALRCPHCPDPSLSPGFSRDQAGNPSAAGEKRRFWSCRRSARAKGTLASPSHPPRCPRLTCSAFIDLAARTLPPPHFAQVCHQLLATVDVDSKDYSGVRAYLCDEREPLPRDAPPAPPDPAPPDPTTTPAALPQALPRPSRSVDDPSDPPSRLSKRPAPALEPTPLPKRLRQPSPEARARPSSSRQPSPVPPDLPPVSTLDAAAIITAIGRGLQAIADALDRLATLPRTRPSLDPRPAPDAAPSSPLHGTPILHVPSTFVPDPPGDPPPRPPSPSPPPTLQRLVADFATATKAQRKSIRHEAKQQGLFAAFQRQLAQHAARRP